MNLRNMRLDCILASKYHEDILEFIIKGCPASAEHQFFCNYFFTAGEVKEGAPRVRNCYSFTGD